MFAARDTSRLAGQTRLVEMAYSRIVRGKGMTGWGDGSGESSDILS